MIVTNKKLSAKKALTFHNGRGAQEGVFAELKSQTQISRRFLGCNDNRVVRINALDVAQTVGEKHAKKDVMVNVLGGLTLVLTLGVLALLVFQIPKMFDVALRVLE